MIQRNKQRNKQRDFDFSHLVLQSLWEVYYRSQQNEKCKLALPMEILKNKKKQYQGESLEESRIARRTSK